MESVNLGTDVTEEREGFPTAEEHHLGVRHGWEQVVGHGASAADGVGANLLWLESELDCSHCSGSHPEEFDNIGRVDVDEISLGCFVHAQFAVEDGGVVRVGSYAAAGLREVVHAAEAGVVHSSSFDVHRLEFGCILLVGEGDGYAVSLMKVGVKEREHLAVGKEPYAT